MLELAMTASGAHLAPTIGFDQLDGFANRGHCSILRRPFNREAPEQQHWKVRRRAEGDLPGRRLGRPLASTSGS
jgi:hypothetical protein